jgi:hypothetical protein
MCSEQNERPLSLITLFFSQYLHCQHNTQLPYLFIFILTFNLYATCGIVIEEFFLVTIILIQFELMYVTQNKKL